LRAIEDYHFTYNVLANKTSSGGMSLFYGKRARALFTATDEQERAAEITDLVAELRAKRPADAEFDEAFAILWLTDDYTADRKTVRYVLARTYEHHQPATALDLSRMTVEHISSQSEGSSRAGELGNLVLVNESLNGKLANKTFSAKQQVLSSAKEWVPEVIVKATAWDDAAIQQRTHALSAEARTKVFRG
jgi:hypothetical protein